METPLGLNYRPFFPVVQSLFKQMDQIKQQRAKAEADAQKTATQLANDAIADTMRFSEEKRPYKKGLEPYFQNRAKETMDLANAVRKGQADPNDLRMYQHETNQAIRETNRKDAVYMTFRGDAEKSGIRVMTALDEEYANDAINLSQTNELGQATYNTPYQWDIDQTIKRSNNNTLTYNAPAMFDKYVSTIMKSEADATLTQDYAGNVINKNQTLKPSLIAKTPGSSGQQTLEFGEKYGTQSAQLLNAWVTMGEDYERYLNIRAEKMFPEAYAASASDNDKRGKVLQDTLRSISSDVGRVPSKPSVQNIPEKGAYNSRWIGGSEKIDADSRQAAQVLHDLIVDHDEEAAGYFEGGPLVESAVVSPDGTSLILKVKQGKLDMMAMMLTKMPGMEEFADGLNESGEVNVPLTRDNLLKLVNWKNSVSSVGDWNGTYVQKAYRQMFEEGIGAEPAPLKPAKPKGPAKPATTTTKTKEAEPINLYADPNDLPTDDDWNEFWTKAKVGTTALDKNGKKVKKKSDTELEYVK